jgi:hypothetical protein
MNERHPIRHFFSNRRIQDEYAMRKGTISPIFMKTIDKFRELGVDTRKVETAPSYNRAPSMIDADKCQDFTMCSITKRTSRERTLEGEFNERLKIFTDGSLKDKRVGYEIVTPETTIKTEWEAKQRYLVPNKKTLSKEFTYLKAKELLWLPRTQLKVRDGKKPKMRRIRELLDQ